MLDDGRGGGDVSCEIDDPLVVGEGLLTEFDDEGLNAMLQIVDGWTVRCEGPLRVDHGFDVQIASLHPLGRWRWRSMSIGCRTIFDIRSAILTIR